MLNNENYGYLVHPLSQFMDNNLKPLTSAYLKVFYAGTSASAYTYSDWEGTLNTSDIMLSMNGSANVIASKDTAYKVMLCDALHPPSSPIWVKDNLYVISSETEIISSTQIKDNAYDDVSDPVRPNNITDIEQLIFVRNVGADANYTSVTSEERIYGVLIPNPSMESDIGKVPMYKAGNQIAWETVENTLTKETDNSDVSSHVDFKNDDETETYASIGSDGVSAKDFKDMDGVSIYDKINAVATTETDNADAEDYVAFGNDAEDEVYARIDKDGVTAMDFKNFDGISISDKLTQIAEVSHDNSDSSERVYFASDDEQEVYACIDKDGIDAKGVKINGKALSRIITVAPSGADYTSLAEAIVEACKVKDTEVRVANGTYDIQSEFKALYGNDFFENMTSSETRLGINLRNGVKVKFDSRAFVVFEYEGENQYVMDLFSPFSLDSWRTAYNFELDGLKIKAKNCRYIVHDEMGTMAYPYTHKFINCVMELDNTASVPNPAQPAFHYTQCIGGGLGKLGNIIIEGCKFTSKDFENANGSAVSYHNSSASDAKSVLNVTGCYFYGGGTFRLSWYGSSTLITDAFVGNNRLGSAIIHNAENAGVYDIHNTNVFNWNNQIGD